ncbi:MAG: hypothetical protein DLM64_05105 [Solirubrobacterales bacterium]|nr:MAG: hypothetical protein DLM64_05105 [Solirubrobacterales bacterium]
MPAPPSTAWLLVGALLLAGCGSASSSSSGTSTASTQTTTGPGASTALGFEGVSLEQGPALAPASTTQTGSIDGIRCGATEQVAYHIHAHLAVFVNGTLRALPAGVGIPGSTAELTSKGPVAAGGQCYYWLHTHAPDGVIHVESPTQRIYTLGEFFDEWHQPLSANRVAGTSGKVTAILNGKPWGGDPRSIPLSPHAVIQLSVGAPAVPFQSVNWAQTQL